MKHVGRVAGSNGDSTQGQKTQPRPRAVWGWIALALSSLWPLAVAGLLLAVPMEPDEITGGLGAAGAIAKFLTLPLVLACVGLVAGICGHSRGEQPQWPARLGILLGSIPAALILVVLGTLLRSRLLRLF